jgi:hypothetical protein
MGIQHSPSTNRYGFAKIITFFFVPFCIVMPTSGERKKGGNLLGGGEGENGKCEMMMMGDDDDEQLFALFVQWHSEGSRMTQNQLLALLLLFELSLLLTGFT